MVDLLERMAQDSYAIAIECDFDARIAALYAQLRLRHSWMYNSFRYLAWNEGDIDELVNETLRRYLKDVGATLLATGGVHASLQPLVEDGELIAFTLPATVEPIHDIEKDAFSNPGGWFRIIARSVLDEYARKAAAATEKANKFRRAAQFPTRHNGEPLNSTSFWLQEELYGPGGHIEEWLVAQCQAGEIRERYVEALTKLPPVQRAAWVLCQDELLTRAEAEPLLGPALHWRTARAALSRKPLQDAEASDLLGRADVSPDASKAKDKLGELLSYLDPLKSSRMPTPKWPREYLASNSGGSGSLRSCVYRAARSISERDKDYIDHASRGSGVSGRNGQQSKSSLNLGSAWFQPRPAAVKIPHADRSQARDLKRIGYRSGSCTNCEGRSVWRSFSPRAMGWTYWCYECGARDEQCRPKSGDQAGPDLTLSLNRDSIQAPKSDLPGPVHKPFPVLPPTERKHRRGRENRVAEASHPSEAADHALAKAPDRNRAVKKISARRSQRSKPPQKASRNAGQRNKLAKGKSIIVRKRRKTSKNVPVKAARLTRATNVPKVPRRGNAPRRARLKPSRN